MNILDENIPKSQTALLESWRIHFRQIGVNIGRRGMSDEEIIPFLLKQHLPTFFTRDKGFYRPRLRHSGYCLVVLDVGKHEVASFIRRFQRHRAFRARTTRVGKVIRRSRAKLAIWSLPELRQEVKLGWFKVA